MKLLFVLMCIFTWFSRLNFIHEFVPITPTPALHEYIDTCQPFKLPSFDFDTYLRIIISGLVFIYSVFCLLSLSSKSLRYKNHNTYISFLDWHMLHIMYFVFYTDSYDTFLSHFLNLYGQCLFENSITIL